MPLELGRPALLHDVGRCFRDLRVIVAHCGHPDYPGFVYDPVALAEKVCSVNAEAAALGLEPIPQRKLDGLFGDNFARFRGLIP